MFWGDGPSTHGWWLLPDGGPTLLDSSDDEQTWIDVLRQVANFQRALAGQAESLAMVPRLSARDAESHLFTLIDGLAARPPSDAQAITAAEASTLSAGLRGFSADMAVLDSLGIPGTLQINDVYLGNACGPAHAGGPFRLFDLGDAFWSHPFAVLHLPLRASSGVGLADPLPPGAEEGALASAHLGSGPRSVVISGPKSCGRRTGWVPCTAPRPGHGCSERSTLTDLVCRRPGSWIGCGKRSREF